MRAIGTVVLLSLVVGLLVGGSETGETATAGTNLLRYPYLQQVTMTSALVAWTTAADGPSFVHYDADGQTTSVPATSDLFVGPAIPDEESHAYFVHVAALQELVPGTTYKYTIETAGEDLTSGQGLSFRTDSGPGSARLSFAVFGDSGSGSGNQLGVRDVMQGREFDLVLLFESCGRFESRNGRRRSRQSFWHDLQLLRRSRAGQEADVRHRRSFVCVDRRVR